MKNMRKKRGFRREPFLPYADFVRAVCAEGCAALPDVRLRRMAEEAAAREDDVRLYAALREMIRRETGKTLFETQLAAAFAMQQGKIAELPTGEGKTLCAVLTAAALALRGTPVHVLAFNDYLAARDCALGTPVFARCGLTASCVTEKTGPAARRAAYRSDVLYIAAKEAAYDELRNFLCMEPQALTENPFAAAIADEADSLLIDAARIPLVLAGEAPGGAEASERAEAIVSALPAGAVESDAETHRVWLTDAGIDAAQALAGADLYARENETLLSAVLAALEAHFLLKNGRDYIVRGGKIEIIDAPTGRCAAGRRFPDALQRAVERMERMERIEPAPQTVIYNMTYMRAFLLRYRFLCGMTGTAASAAQAFRRLYGLSVCAVPPHRPCIRQDEPDAVFPDVQSRDGALLRRLRAENARGRPVLVGTGSVRESEALSARLSAEGLDHSVLNAREDAREAAVIAQAGRPGRITISTNMAGRGVDIRLGGADGAAEQAVRAAGGLLVLGTALNRSRRLDDQLRGRAGRQGDPGGSRFYLATPEGGDGARALRRQQREAERQDTETRYILERYAAVLEERRAMVSAYRKALLCGGQAPALVRRHAPALHRALCAAHGEAAVEKAERQLTLYFLTRCWSDYLAAMEDKRRGIHLEVVAGRDPLDSYRRFAFSAFEEMQADLREAVLNAMARCTITGDGVDLEREGFSTADAAWAYWIDDRADQFSRLPALMGGVSGAVRKMAEKTAPVRRLFSRIG